MLVELAFTPRDLLPPEADELTVEPSPTVYTSYEAGAWAYPPKDYDKWGGLIAAHAQHCLERYGEEEVTTWLWELWNEPDIYYWRGTPEQFNELYSVTARAIRSVLPERQGRRPGGHQRRPGVHARASWTTPRAATSPLDFVSFHTKGCRVPDPASLPADRQPGRRSS